MDDTADLDMAADVALDSKVQYPVVCNAVETLLVSFAMAEEFVPRMVSLHRERGVDVRGDGRICALADAVLATKKDWDTEYGDLIISVGVVDSLRKVVDFINTHGFHYTDAIITFDPSRVTVFVANVDSADVFINAFTRFVDDYRYRKGEDVGYPLIRFTPADRWA